MNVKQEIANTLRLIETDYPEIYVYLDEDPTTLKGSSSKFVSENEMMNYLESLKEKIRQHKKTHSAPTSHRK
ncbi:hypothetical protein [Fulvivirga sp.]|uniref:hypothetical protein n=1 Tax=Fulvivirga sp. TaxID=1931237 RepID=UPI0032EAC7E3